MSEIDWSKAPKEATHACPKYGRFYKKDRKGLWFQNGFFWCLKGDSDGLTDLVSRPEEAASPAWNGEGLPPVGTVLEYMWNYRAHGSEYVNARVIVHDNGKAVVRVVSGEHKDCLGESNGGLCGDEPVWRPIRTPEQIAAEERETGVRDLKSVAFERFRSVSAGCDAIDAICEALYDAGYRKTEGAK